MIAVFGILWLLSGTAWWWIATRKVRSDFPFWTTFEGTLFVPMTFLIYVPFGSILWLVSDPKAYRGPR